MDISAATTALGLINSAVQTAKTAIELAKSSKDAALKQTVSDVLDGILDLKMKVLDIEEENRELKQKLLDQEAIERKGEFGYYFKSGEVDPLCPKCYEESNKLIHLPASEPWSGGIKRDCRTCNHTYWESRWSAQL